MSHGHYLEELHLRNFLAAQAQAVDGRREPYYKEQPIDANHHGDRAPDNQAFSERLVAEALLVKTV